MKTRVLEFRKSKGMTQAELAKAAGVGLSAIRRLEIGTADGMTLKTIIKVARALEVSVSELLKEEKDKE